MVITLAFYWPEKQSKVCPRDCSHRTVLGSIGAKLEELVVTGALCHCWRLFPDLQSLHLRSSGQAGTVWTLSKHSCFSQWVRIFCPWNSLVSNVTGKVTQTLLWHLWLWFIFTVVKVVKLSQLAYSEAHSFTETARGVLWVTLTFLESHGAFLHIGLLWRSLPDCQVRVEP